MLGFSKNRLYNITIVLILILGIFLRTKAYLFIRPLWHDETALAYNILRRNIFGFFTPLDFLQKAPPLFMSGVKLVTTILSPAELQLRLIPFLSSIGSVIIFYLLSNKILLKKGSILIANLLFAINYYLIYYAQEFKQYSTDVFLILLSLLLFEKIDLKQLSYKKIFLYSLISIILILFSFPMLFAILAFITINLIKADKEIVKKLTLYAVPIGIVSLIYYTLMLLPTRNMELEFFNYYWNDGFIKPNIISIFSLIKKNMSYYFHPNDSAWILTLPALIGIYALIKESKKIHYFIFLIFSFAILASMLHLYPIKERIALYLLPIILLLIAKPIDLFSRDTKLLTLTIVYSFLISYSQYSLNYFILFFDKTAFEIQNARTSMQIVTENFKPNNIFVYNKASEADCDYYLHYFNFNPKKHILLNPHIYAQKSYFDIFNKLPKNQSYWFYFSFDYKERPVIGFLREWIQINHIKYSEFQYKRSHVLYVKL